MIDEKIFFRRALDSDRNTVPVLRLYQERAQDQHVESALEEWYALF